MPAAIVLSYSVPSSFNDIAVMRAEFLPGQLDPGGGHGVLQQRDCCC